MSMILAASQKMGKNFWYFGCEVNSLKVNIKAINPGRQVYETNYVV